MLINHNTISRITYGFENSCYVRYLPANARRRASRALETAGAAVTVRLFAVHRSIVYGHADPFRDSKTRNSWLVVHHFHALFLFLSLSVYVFALTLMRRD